MISGRSYLTDEHQSLSLSESLHDSTQESPSKCFKRELGSLDFYSNKFPKRTQSLDLSARLANSIETTLAVDRFVKHFSAQHIPTELLAYQLLPMIDTCNNKNQEQPIQTALTLPTQQAPKLTTQPLNVSNTVTLLPYYNYFTFGPQLLPKEIYLKILDMVSFKDLLSIRRVCKFCYAVSSEKGVTKAIEKADRFADQIRVQFSDNQEEPIPSFSIDEFGNAACEYVERCLTTSGDDDKHLKKFKINFRFVFQRPFSVPSIRLESIQCMQHNMLRGKWFNIENIPTPELVGFCASKITIRLQKISWGIFAAIKDLRQQEASLSKNNSTYLQDRHLWVQIFNNTKGSPSSTLVNSTGI